MQKVSTPTSQLPPGSIDAEASTVASTPRTSGSPGLSSTWSSFTPPSPRSRPSSPGLSRKDMRQQQSVDSYAIETLASLLRNRELVERLRVCGNASNSVLVALAALGEQAVTMGIDYLSLGHSWNHPTTRKQYRQACHPSTTCVYSRQRGEASRMRLQEVVMSIISGSRNAEDAVIEMFLAEIGAATEGIAKHATFSGVMAALSAELLLPLRALQEGQNSMHRTYFGEAVPPSAVKQTVYALISATLSKPDGFSEWRYNNLVGMEQLRGLTRMQIEKWKEPTSVAHAEGIRTHEDHEGELGFFWATKIGGPSHGFDYEGQCLLPLLANARNKVVLVSDSAWSSNPVGRAHFRMLWTAPEFGASEPRLWLEAVNRDFDATNVDMSTLTDAVLSHAVEKAEAMGIPLSLDPMLSRELALVCSKRRVQCTSRMILERLVLRPSNGVCEASDFLSHRHDWVQQQEEVTEPISRALYVPASCRASRIQHVSTNPM